MNTLFRIECETLTGNADALIRALEGVVNDLKDFKSGKATAREISGYSISPCGQIGVEVLNEEEVDYEN